LNDKYVSHNTQHINMPFTKYGVSPGSVT